MTALQRIQQHPGETSGFSQIELDRFFSKFVVQGDGCWQWTDSLVMDGYGTLWRRSKGRSVRAHRMAYELFVGPIPHGLVIDHLCRNRGCVNPAHLEAVTDDENKRRGLRFADRPTHCPKGHEYTPENMYPHPRGWRDCLTCRRERDKNRPPRAKTRSLSRQLRNRSSPLSDDPTLDATGQGRAGAGDDFADHAPPLSVGEEPGSPPGKATGTPPVIPGAGRRPLFGGHPQRGREAS